MADLQVFWVPTAITMKACARELPPGAVEAENAWRILEHQLKQISLARQLGVPVAVGTDSGSLGVHHGLAVSGEVGLLMEAGYSLEEAVCCATQDASRLLGLRNEMGQIKKGMEGTFIVIEGPPETLMGADLLEQRPQWAANHGPMWISTRGASAGIPSGARFHHPEGIQAITRGVRP